MKSGRHAVPRESDEAMRRQIADNIRTLRRIQHLTQAELARRVGIRAGPMNAIEQGRHVPSGRVLYRLADILGATVDAILGRSPASTDNVSVVRETGSRGIGVVKEPEDPPCYITAADRGDWPRAVPVALPDDSWLESYGQMSAVCRAFLTLEDLCGAQKRAHIPLYLPYVATPAGVEALSQQVRQILGVGQAVIFDYIELLENAGLRVVFCPLAGRAESAAYYDPVNCNAFLVVRTGMNVERQLFELAKRLGSIYIHTQTTLCPPKEPAVAAGTLDALHTSRKFAALFLMPASAVQASVAQLGIAPGEWTYDLLLRLKHRFGVSAQSFVMRLKELDLISPAAATGIEKRIESHYQRTRYSEPDASRRILSPNGRLGDLLLAALQKPEAKAEARAIAGRLRELGVEWRSPHPAGKTRQDL